MRNFLFLCPLDNRGKRLLQYPEQPVDPLGLPPEETLHGWPERAGEPAFATEVTRLVLDLGVGPVLTALSIEAGEAAGAQLPALRDRAERVPAFPLSGSHILARGVRAGPELGRVLARAREAWIAASCPLDEARLAAIVEQVLNEGIEPGSLSRDSG